MKTLFFSLLILSVSLLVSPTETVAQSKQALKEASTLFSSEGTKLCTLSDKFEKAKTTDAKIKTLDDIYVYFKGFWKKIVDLNAKYPELGNIMDETSAMKGQSEKFFECIGKFGMMVSNITESAQTDEKLIKAFDEFSQKMDALTTELDENVKSND